MLNLQLGTDDELTGLSVLALYNVIGPRIVEVGALGLPDAIEQPFHRVDVVIKQRLPLGFSVSLQGKNLLDLAAEKTLGAQTVESVQRGRTFSIGLSWSL
jgi:outer membrane receptor protein involved in Fe transport